MSSCEKSRTRAYSSDIRWRVVWQHEGLQKSVAEIASNLCIDKSTVHRMLKLFRDTGQVCPKQYPKEKAFRKLTKTVQAFVLGLVIDRPGIYLKEVQAELKAVFDISIDVSAICKFLASAGFTRQRLQITAVQRDEYLRQKFAADVALFPADMFIFIDETGADNRNCIRKYGYSCRGKPLRSQKLLVRGERVSAIACMSMAGILDVKTCKGTTDGDDFYSFIQTHLLPHVQPFNFSNPHSIVVLDNCSVHHVPEVVQSIEDVGCLVLFLPPYSPDLNPVEEAFSKVKTILKSYDTHMEHIHDVETLLLMSFCQITAEDCVAWINHSKIYNV